MYIATPKSRRGGWRTTEQTPRLHSRIPLIRAEVRREHNAAEKHNQPSVTVPISRTDLLFSRGKDGKVENAAALFSSKLEKRPLQKLIIGGTATTLTAAHRQQRIGVNTEKQIPVNGFVVIIPGFASTDRKGLADTLARHDPR